MQEYRYSQIFNQAITDLCKRYKKIDKYRKWSDVDVYLNIFVTSTTSACAQC